MFRDINGNTVTHFDENRAIWYTAGSVCGYWTDNWSKLSSNNGIPCCPICRCVGYIITFKKWIEQAKIYEEGDYKEPANPWYRKFLLDTKEICTKEENFTFLQRYALWKKLKGLL